MLLLGGSLIPRRDDGYNSQHCDTTALIVTGGLALVGPTRSQLPCISISLRICDLPLLVLSVLQPLIIVTFRGPHTVWIRPAMTPK
jgi:hypothetical protein